ncbi:hypothetical protein [Kutzneria albida]|uniref:Uncharacterized protein n=1 Tax=Kutzneria albida DSM 43870 TaxID=1449976 RepID=W5WJZ6_9PSEU|nr:hypothetical protein [Kutzneria albida]AHI00902.1 hypothetical protein KALB_7544 [Kutzneria albida DSM 43870]
MSDGGELNRRELALLRAVADGRAELLCGCEPDLAVDGAWCGHGAARTLVVGGLIRPVFAGAVGQLVAAELTDLGHAVLAATATGVAA